MEGRGIYKFSINMWNITKIYFAFTEIFTLRKYGNTDNQNEPNVNGRNCKMKSFVEPSPDKNRNIKKTGSTKKSKGNSSKKSTKTDRDCVRTSSMVEFFEDVSNLQSSN